jgi:hypothetical protein
MASSRISSIVVDAVRWGGNLILDDVMMDDDDDDDDDKTIRIHSRYATNYQ